MKHNFMTKMVSALLAVVLSTAAFSVTAFASGGEENTESVTEQETVGDVSDLLSALAGSQVTVSVTEDGIQFSSGENDSGQTGTVTTGGGNLNVRTGAGMDYTAFTQIPNGTTVKVIGTDGDWLKVILPEKVGYVYSGYMTVSDGEAGSGEGSFSLDAETLENLLGMLGGGLNDGAALTPDGNLSLIDDIGSPTASGKQFITVETKNGNTRFNIDRPADFKGHSLSVSDIVVLHQDGKDTAHYCDRFGFSQVPEFLQPERAAEVTIPTPDQMATQERINTPRGSFCVTNMTREQMEAAGYGVHHQSDDGKYLIMGNGTRAFAVLAEQPEKGNPLRTVEMTLEDDYGMIDGVINNGRRGEELEKAQEYAERTTPEKPSIRERLEDAKRECAEHKPMEGKKPGRDVPEHDCL